MKPPTLLLVEDDRELAQLTHDYLCNHGFSVSREHDGAQAAARILAMQPDIVVLDIMLPGKDGFAICREVRPHYHGPILMLTARDEDMDQLLGLELGADDYVTKPVVPRLLLARLHALLRRSQPFASSPVTLEFPGLQINRRCREVYWQQQPVTLTTAEYNLLELLASHAGQVLSRDDILLHLRGIDYDGTDRSIDLRISRLRKKLPGCACIKTVRGKGYLFAADAHGSRST